MLVDKRVKVEGPRIARPQAASAQHRSRGVLARQNSVSEEAVLNEDWLDEIKWDDKGLVAAVAQETGSGKILMMAWMNRESLALTRQTGHAVYWSRSRGRLWHKGEESGHQQIVHAMRLDCDADVILLEVEQKGGIACHTGRHNCFFRELRADEWVEIAPVLEDPDVIYKKT
jgi:phosphoribosyl-AMP cyclohydrolase